MNGIKQLKRYPNHISRMRHTFLWLCLLLLGTACTVDSSAYPINTPSTQAEEDFAPVVDAYANTFGVTEEGALHRLELQNVLTDLDEQLAREEPSYAGSWLAHEPAFGITIAFTTDDGEEIVQRYIEGTALAELITVEQVMFSLEELGEIQQAIIEASQEEAWPLLFQSGENFSGQKVTLYTTEPDALRELVEASPAASIYAAHVEYVFQEALSTLLVVSPDDPKAFLTEHRWLLFGVFPYQTLYFERYERMEIDALSPTYLWFDREKNVMVIETPCVEEDGGRQRQAYDVELQEQTMMLQARQEIIPACDERVLQQLAHLVVDGTFEYEIHNGVLFMEKEEVLLLNFEVVNGEPD